MIEKISRDAERGERLGNGEYQYSTKSANDRQGHGLWRFVMPRTRPVNRPTLGPRPEAPRVLFPRPHPHKTPPAISPAALQPGLSALFREVLVFIGNG